MAREELARLLSCLLKCGQSARCCDGAKTNCPNDGVEQETPNEAKKKQSERETFFFERFCRLLAH